MDGEQDGGRKDAGRGGLFEAEDLERLAAGAVPVRRGHRPPPATVTAAVTRGVCRWLDDQGFAALTEFKLANRRRADVVGLGVRGTILMVEVKSTIEDFRADDKWLEYLPYCDAFAFAVPSHFPWQILPRQCGVIVADHHSALVVRTSPHHPIRAPRRKAITLQFALTAGERLRGIIDPRL
jgi:hypothetical protein